MRKKTVRALRGGRGFRGIASLVLAVAACAPRVAVLTRSSLAAGRSGVCELLAPPSVAASSLHIAVTDAITPADAPLPRTDAERVIFPLLYTPASNVTCRPRSGSQLVEPRRTAIQDGASGSPPLLPPILAAGWPPATGRYSVVSAVGASLELLPRRSRSGPDVHVTRIPAAGGRDALDGATDVLITTDATTIAYAAARADLVSVPLPWSHVYVLVQPDTPTHIDRDTARILENDLATDAVRVDARPVDDPQAGDALVACDTAAAAVTSTSLSAPQISSLPGRLANRIVYADDDQVARALSERVVALANAHDPRLAALAPGLVTAEPVRAVGYDTTGFRDALATGRDVAYVAAMDVTEICRDVATLVSEAPWAAPTASRLRAAITPLVETRAHAIVRRGRVGVAVDDAGTVYLEFGAPAGR